MEDKDRDDSEDDDEGISMAGSVDWRERPWQLRVETVDCDAGGVSTGGIPVRSREDCSFRVDDLRSSV
jgi:hypothetical protein